VKLLGIDIDYPHISAICRKAPQQLNSLKRLSSYLNRLNKLTIFHTFILSNINFCPLAWHFCTDKNSKKLEKVQERAPVCLHDLFHMKNSKYSFRYNNILEIKPQIKSTRYDKKSFRFAAPTLWNSLPDHFRTENSFSPILKSWNGSKCRCSTCR
jgi:hypothetical protein